MYMRDKSKGWFGGLEPGKETVTVWEGISEEKGGLYLHCSDGYKGKFSLGVLYLACLLEFQLELLSSQLIGESGLQGTI
jgi:hypothetical protein